MSADLTAGHRSTVAPKFKRDDRYFVLELDFGVIWVADFDNAARPHNKIQMLL